MCHIVLNYPAVNTAVSTDTSPLTCHGSTCIASYSAGAFTYIWARPTFRHFRRPDHRLAVRIVDPIVPSEFTIQII